MADKIPQNSTDYRPTEKEKNMLEALLNPENRMKSVTDICRIAKCDRKTYYNAFTKPGFVELYKKKSAELAEQSISSVVNAFIKQAQRGSFQHGKLILEMAGVYTEKSKVETTVTTKNELSELLEQRRKRVDPDAPE